MENRSSQVKAFRLSRALVEMLSQSSSRHGISENSLVERVLTKSLKTEMLTHTFECVTVGKETFRSIIGMTDADGLEIAGDERGRRAFSLAKELFAGEDEVLDFPGYLTEVLGDCAHWFRVEGTRRKPDRITICNDYGPRWSVFLESYFRSANEVTSKAKLEWKDVGDIITVTLNPSPDLEHVRNRKAPVFNS